MAIYAIGDLHLSGHSDKPMDIFGDHWIGHENKIKASWLKKVSENDAVLIPGDISWAMTLEKAMVDLEWIASLPGTKYLIRGNHDYWWKSITKLNLLFDSMNFIQNNSFIYMEYVICGARGWLCPNDYKFTDHDRKIYLREAHRLEMSLKSAKQQGDKEIIAMMHYPPTNEKLEPSLFTEIFEKYNVGHVIYGHLHDETSHNCGLQGTYNGVNYRLTSCDYLDFELERII